MSLCSSLLRWEEAPPKDGLTLEWVISAFKVVLDFQQTTYFTWLYNLSIPNCCWDVYSLSPWYLQTRFATKCPLLEGFLSITFRGKKHTTQVDSRQRKLPGSPRGIHREVLYGNWRKDTWSFGVITGLMCVIHMFFLYCKFDMLYICIFI